MMTERYYGYGRWRTVREWADSPACRVTISELRRRLKAGWELSAALTYRRPSKPSDDELRAMRAVADGVGWGDAVDLIPSIEVDPTRLRFRKKPATVGGQADRSRPERIKGGRFKEAYERCHKISPAVPMVSLRRGSMGLSV